MENTMKTVAILNKCMSDSYLSPLRGAPVSLPSEVVEWF